MRSRLVAVAAVLALAGCGGSGGTGPEAPTTPGSEVLGSAAGTPSAAPPAATPTTAKPAVKALTCTQLKNAHLGSPSVKYNGYPDYIPLADGIWSGEDGANVELRECGIGDLNNDGAADGLASIVLSTGGTGHFYSLAYWRNDAGNPVFAALKDLDDRTPVEKITISGNVATVVWLTRTPDLPAAAVNIRRTSKFKVSGTTLTEISHTDAPYTP